MRGRKVPFIASGMFIVLTLTSVLDSSAATPEGRVAVGSMEYDGYCGEEIIAFEAHDQIDGTWHFTFVEKQGACPGLALQYRTAPGSPEAGFSGGIQSVSSSPWAINSDGTFTVARLTWHLYVFSVENITGPASGTFVVNQ